jgi:ABC-type lipoprotein export system ATPase subunit
MIELKNVTKMYKSGAETVIALNNATLSLQSGDYLSIVGPSGAGKSTLLHILGGLDTPSSGNIHYKGQNIAAFSDNVLSLWRNKTVGFVFQFYHLIEELTVLENITLAASQNTKKSSLKKAQDLLQYLGLDKRGNFYPSQLSGGEKQKTAIARALINDPEIILCDEPTGNLDVDSQDKVVSLLEDFQKREKKTLVLITHNLDLAKRAKKIIRMQAGHIVA